jgi:hypothetical protein
MAEKKHTVARATEVTVGVECVWCTLLHTHVKSLCPFCFTGRTRGRYSSSSCRGSTVPQYGGETSGASPYVQCLYLPLPLQHYPLSVTGWAGAAQRAKAFRTRARMLPAPFAAAAGRVLLCHDHE